MSNKEKNIFVELQTKGYHFILPNKMCVEIVRGKLNVLAI